MLIVLARMPSDFSRKGMRSRSGKDRKKNPQIALLVFSEDLNVCDLDLPHTQDIR